MNRLWVGIGLLVLFLAMGIGVMQILDRIQQPVMYALVQAAEEALSENPQAGMETAQQALALWNKSRRGIAAVSLHGPMEEIDGLFAQLPAYAQAEHWADFSACCARLAKMVEAMGESQGLSWWSLL